MLSDPVTGKDFFGRQELAAILKKRAESFFQGFRQNVALIGAAKLGKTSVLHHFLYTTRRPEVLQIYVELRSPTFRHFADQFIRSLLFQYLERRAPVGLSESYETLLHLARPTIPETVKQIVQIQKFLSRNDVNSAYARLFELTSHTAKETGLKAIVILDEFHHLGDWGIKDAFQNFGKQIMLQKNTLYILASSAAAHSRQILAEKLSLLFGHFERIQIEPFSFEESHDFIDKTLHPVAIDGNLKRFLMMLTDGHPFTLKTVCVELRRLALEGASVSLDRTLFLEGLKRVFFDAEGSLSQYFMSRLAAYKIPKEPSTTLLMAIAQGRNKLKELSRKIQKNPTDTSRLLKELIAAELIIKNGVFYHVPEKAFAFWLTCAYPLKEHSVALDFAAKAECFRAACVTRIDEFIKANAVSAPERIAELLRHFKNEQVEFESKRKQLPEFKKISLCMRDETHSASIMARSPRQSWVCKILEERSTEKDVLEFARETGEGIDGSRKILISLGGMDQNAKLLAINQKIWTLNLHKINALLDLYGQTKIIRTSPRAASETPQTPAGH